MKSTAIVFAIALLSAATLVANAETGKTREQVRAELAAAQHNGDMISGETGLTERERFPYQFPARPMAAGKTRAQVKAELVLAIREGDIYADDTGLTLRDQQLQRQAKSSEPSAEATRLTAARGAAPL